MDGAPSSTYSGHTTHGEPSMPRHAPRVAFLFLGETLLIPHLYPILEALSRQGPNAAIDAWVATSVHEALLARWLTQAGLADRVRLCRAPGFRTIADLPEGQNPPLPSKLPTLIRLIPQLLRAQLIVCAEQTSMWLPCALPFLGWRFVNVLHGAGPMMNRADMRRRAAYRLLVPAAKEKARLVGFGVQEDRIEAVGYVKAGFHALAAPPRLFTDDKPVVVYAPHWQQHRSSWWAWGREIVAMLAAQDRFNVILAPHQRLVEKAPEVRDVLAAVAHLPHVHADCDSFAMVDGSYMAAADIYLGDTSSQVVEYLIRPRPCLFLNPQGADWAADPDYGFWRCGEVVERLDGVLDGLGRAGAIHARYEPVQRAFAAEQLGDASPAAAVRAAEVIRAAL
jgi:hypothetical protein